MYKDFRLRNPLDTLPQPKKKKSLFPYELFDLGQIIESLSLFLLVVSDVKFVSALCLVDKMGNVISLPILVNLELERNLICSGFWPLPINCCLHFMLGN